MSQRRKRSRSSSSDEDLRSLMIKKKQKDDLYVCQVVTCEFCDEAFWNRYNYLVHNASHIIIPLLKKNYFKCSECHLQCRTDRKLRKHMKKHHPNMKIHHKKKKYSTDSDSKIEIPISNNKYDYIIGCKKDTNSNIELGECNSNIEHSVSNSIIESHIPGDKCDLKKELIHYDNVEIDSVKDILKLEQEAITTTFSNGNSNVGVEIIDIESDDNIDINKEVPKKESTEVVEKEKIRNRLVFEEEEDIINPNGLMNDLISDIKVSVDVEPWMCSIADNRQQEAINKQNEEWRSKTVSYQELMGTKEVECLYCNGTFPNRLSLIVHETSQHLRSKKRYPFLCPWCDWYVADNPRTLKNHYVKTHPEKGHCNVTRNTCSICKLKYINIQKHMRNYHRELTIASEETVTVKETEEKISNISFNKRVIKVCDLCSSFMKNVHNNVSYKTVGEKSECGKRQWCERCFKPFFNVKLIEIRARLIKVASSEKKSKTVSNMDRLKNFKNRLKLMNTIKKYCFWFYLLPVLAVWRVFACVIQCVVFKIHSGCS